MIRHRSDSVLEITAHDPQMLEHHLNLAETIAIARAMEDRQHGIMVTRIDYSTYTVALTRDVPYGETHERQETTGRN